jgi:hypothetical protein
MRLFTLAVTRDGGVSECPRERDRCRLVVFCKRSFPSGGSPLLPVHDAYGVFGVLYSTSFWNGFHTVS